jgi:hypothetical protein
MELLFTVNSSGYIHREDDLPAVIRADGTKMWWKWVGYIVNLENTVEYPSGRQEWWIGGEKSEYQLHREDDLPAVIEPVFEISISNRYIYN